MEYNRSELKRGVRQSMRGSGCMVVTLLLTVVVSAGAWLLNTVLGGLLTGGMGSLDETVLRYMQQGYEAGEAVYITLLELYRRGPGALAGLAMGGFVLSIVLALWRSVMDVGYKGWCLGMVRRENPPVGKIFCALPLIGPVLLTRLLTGLFVFLWGLLVAMGYGVMLFAGIALMTATDSVLIGLPLILVAVVCLALGIIWVSVRYALVDYVLLDKGFSGMEALRENKRLMKGNTGRVFLLQLSFIGWYLLLFIMIYAGIMLALIPLIMQASAPSTGGLIAASGFALLVLAAVAVGVSVLSLWLRPYVTGSMARFYDWAGGGLDGPRGGTGFGGDGGWDGSGGYTWTSGPRSGTGTGTGSGGGLPPRPPAPPRDDPWN